VTSWRPGGLGDVDAHAAAGAGDEPDLLVSFVTHVVLFFPLCRVVVGDTASSAVTPSTQPAVATMWEAS
jgi:hypothetical protein